MKNVTQSILNVGADGAIIETECHVSNGLPAIIIVGLGGKAVDEAKERIRSAFASSKLNLPKKRLTINLAPADLPKEGTGLDLSIAAAILSASGQIKPLLTEKDALIGELGLDGTIRPVRGVIGKLLVGKRRGLKRFFIPSQNLQQASLIPEICLVSINSLADLYKILSSQISIPDRLTGGGGTIVKNYQASDYSPSHVIGQEQAKRGLEIAAAGGHNILLKGPPGTGKSMLAKTLISILPPMNQQEMLEITHLHSLSSNNYDHLVTARPFRAPHHSASHTAIVGGGHHLRPGEISLSHRGVLLFDEFPEFNRQTLEALRQPLEDRHISLSRIKQTTTYPADFIFVATANPCPCGYYGTSKSCHCLPHQILRYQQKMSGPIIDRIDLHIAVEDVEHRALLQTQENSSGDEQIRQRVAQARLRQERRFSSNIKLNAHMTNNDIKSLTNLDNDAKDILDKAADRLNISTRSYLRLIKVARTIADLNDSHTIRATHITEALQYRSSSAELNAYAT